MLEHLTRMARYNAWANTRLYDAVAALPGERWKEDTGLFFRSIHGTLNHLLAADLIWMARFEGQSEIVGLDAPTRLDAVCFDELQPMREARERLDAHMIDFVKSHDEASIHREISFTPITDPTPVTQVLSPTLAHVFNHQTHHRGQCHAGLTRLVGDAPPMDLVYYLREERLGKAA